MEEIRDRIKINAQTPYDIVIGRGILKNAGELISEVLEPCKICVVTDSNVGELYGEELLISLADAGFSTCIFKFEAGEPNKNTTTLVNMLEYMARQEMTRADAVVALGGGVAGDMAGFAASVFMRGIKYIQIPTSLLACLDSSVGGKTATDLVAGKNYIGTFWQPSMVICDLSLLETLPKERYADGLAEAIKCGVIRSRELFQYLGGVSPEAGQIIRQSIEIKKSVVEEDEREQGMRAVLNFGHTVGHAIEKCSNYTISHGQAVAIGMVVISRAAYNRGITEEDLSVPISVLLQHCGLETESPFSAADLAEAMMSDKKRRGNTIRLVLAKDIGKAFFHDLPVSDLRAFISSGV